MRICFVISSLGAGGAERVAVNLVNQWARAGHEVTLLTLASAGDDFYRLDRCIDRRGLGLLAESTGRFSGVVRNLHRIRRLRRELRAIRPDAIVSFVDRTNVLALISSVGLGIPIIVSERTDPRKYPLGLAWEALRRLTYRHAKALVVQTHSVAQWARYIVSPRRVVTIPNPIGESFFQVERNECGGARVRRVVAIGRLSAEKGFDILIEAFARASTLHPSWSLVIVGGGPLAGTLRAQADATLCADRIVFTGLVHEPEQLLASSEIFVLSSRFEGFGNALVEGMACGCCVISSDCPSGPAEIITRGVDGVLVPVDDSAALADALQALMTDGAERRRLGTAASASAERFRADRIAERWIQLLRSVSGAAATKPVAANGPARMLRRVG